MHSVQSKVVKVDYELMKFSNNDETHIKHMLFKHSTRTERIIGLNLNKLLNGRL